MSDIENIKGFRDTAEEIFKSSAEGFTKLFLNHIQIYSDELNRFHNNLKEIHDENFSVDKIRLLIHLQREFHVWIASIEDICQWIREEQTFDSLKDRFSQLLQEYPENISFDVTDDFWRYGPDDSFIVKIGKRYRKVIISLKNAGIRMRNRVARLFGKHLINRYNPVRVFNQHNFFRFYFEIPVLKSYVNEIQRIIKQAADQLCRLHDSLEKFNRTILFKEYDMDGNFMTGSEKSSMNLAAVDENIDTISAVHDSIGKSLDEALSGFNETLDAASADYTERWGFAGTFILPGRKFDARKLGNAVGKTTSRLAKNQKLWDIHFRGEEGEWLKDIELTILQLESEIACMDTIKTIQTVVTDKLFPALENADRTINSSLEKFKDERKLSRSDLVTLIRAERAVLVRNLSENVLPHIMDAVLHANIIHSYQSYITRIRSALDAVADAHSIFKVRDVENVPPVSKVSRVALKELVMKEVFQPIVSKHGVSENSLNNRIEQSMRALAEIDQIVDYNMNTALILLEEHLEEEALDKAYTLVIEVFERTQTQLSELKTGFEKIASIAAEDLNGLTSELKGDIQKMADNDKVFELKIRLARAKTREKILNNIRFLLTSTKRLVRSLVPNIIEFAHRLRSGYNRIRKITGLAPVSKIMDLKLTEFLSESQTRLSRLPYVYQRLFSSQSLTDRRFFSSREEEIMEIKNAFSLWQAGKDISVSLIGERGSGKTSLLYFAGLDIFEGTPIVTVELNKKIFEEEDLFNVLKESFNESDVKTLDELEERIAHHEERRICIFENLHNLFFRTVYGLDAIERFILLVQRTERSIFWIITCALYGWMYLDKVIHISSYLGKSVELGLEKREEVEDTIIKRHRVSGYLLRFETPPDILKSRAFKKLSSDEERQPFLREQFFNQLVRLASGNIRVALLFWLMAIKEITKDTMIVSSEIEFDHTFVYQLPAEELFSLAALIQHEHLDTHMHALIFSQDIRVSEMILNRMLHKGYLQKNDDLYSIHPFLYRPVVKALKSKNILQ
ncbi:MAG TPA: hypothetical protein VMZ04_01555 [Anaerolineae bacterium]|nr:hypothetical protein [Anaerolineae bacterium]